MKRTYCPINRLLNGIYVTRVLTACAAAGTKHTRCTAANNQPSATLCRIPASRLIRIVMTVAAAVSDQCT